MAWTRACLAVSCLLIAAASPAAADQGDPLSPLISHIEAFLHREESDGVTLDSRHFFSFPEHLRLTVVPQLAAFCDLQRFNPTDSRYLDITERADFLVRMGSNARSFDAADGMLAYALLRAFEITGNPSYRNAAQPILDGFLLTPVQGDVNRILMAGLALAEDVRLSSDPVALTRLGEILLLTARLQHADGSFDHVCDGARDIHYTAWTSVELDLITRLVPDPGASRVLDRAQAFLGRWIGADGTIQYQEASPLGITLYYYSKPVCSSDYDTRGWINELGYHAVLFDRLRDARYNVMASRLASIESQGALPDKWAYLPSANDPSYIWSTSSRSVVRTSLVFWALATIQSRRADRGRVVYGSTVSAPTTGAAPGVPRAEGVGGASGEPSLTLSPNPAHGQAWIALRLPRPTAARVHVLDASGRRVRELLDEPSASGSRMLRWDGRDQRGAPAAPGVYFVRLQAEGAVHTARLVWIESGR